MAGQFAENPIVVVLNEDSYNELIKPYLIKTADERIEFAIQENRAGSFDHDKAQRELRTLRHSQEYQAASQADREKMIKNVQRNCARELAPDVKQRTRGTARALPVPPNGYRTSRISAGHIDYDRAYSLRHFKEQMFLGGNFNKFLGHGASGAGYSANNGSGFQMQVAIRQSVGESEDNLPAFLEQLEARTNRRTRVIYPGKTIPGLHPGFISDVFGASTFGDDDLVTNPYSRFDAMIIRIPNAAEIREYQTNGTSSRWPDSWFQENGNLNQHLLDAQGMIPGAWVAFVVYTDDQYLDARKRLQNWMANARVAYAAGKILDTYDGSWISPEEAAAQVRRQEELQGKTFTKPPPPPEPDAEALLRVRLENAQGLLVTAMADMTQINGIRPILRKAEDLSRLKNGTSRRDYPDKKLLDKISPECLNLYDGEPQSLVDILANPFGLEEFFCATPAQLAYLQPKLQFYLDGKPVEFPDYSDGDLITELAKAKVSNAQAIKNVFRSRGTVGTDVGIKNFTWFFEGPHRGDTTLKASLQLYFGNSMELLNDDYLKFIFGPSGGKSGKAGAAAWKKSKKKNLTAKELSNLSAEIQARLNILKDPKTDFYAPRNPYSRDLEESQATGFRRDTAPPELTLQVGWAVPHAAEGELDPNFISAVKKTQRLLKLRMYQYQVEYGEQGQLHLTLDYTGGIDEFLGQADKSNVFDSGLDLGELHSRKVFVKTGTRLGLMDANKGGIFDIQGYFVEDQEGLLDIAGLPRLTKVAWPEGYIKRQLNDGQNKRLDRLSKVFRVGVSAAGVMYELKTLRLIKKQLTAHSPPKSRPPADQKRIDQYTQYIDVANGVLTEIRTIQSDLIYSAFISRLLGSGKLYYATVRSDLLNGIGDGFKKSVGVGSGLKRGKVTLGDQGMTTGWKVDVKGGLPASVSGIRSAEKRFREGIQFNSGAAAQGQPQIGAAFLDPTNVALCPEPDVDDKHTVLYYMKLGDILDLILCGLKDKPHAPDVEYILGSFYPHMYGVPNTTSKDIYSLADIPISMDYFGHWFMQSFLSKRTTPSVSYQQFANELFSGLVANLFNRVLRSTTGSKNLGMMVFGNSTIASPLRIPSGSKRSPSMGRLVGQRQMTSLARNKGDTSWSRINQREYYLMYLKQLNPLLNGNRDADHRRGIYHLVLGADRGLVKKFSFSQVDIPYLKEMMIEEANYAQGVFLPQNVEILMVGNTFFRNGQTIYVNADFGLGAAAKRLGVGGYYTVVRVENFIEAGKYETRLKCQLTKQG